MRDGVWFLLPSLPCSAHGVDIPVYPLEAATADHSNWQGKIGAPVSIFDETHKSPTPAR